MFSQLPILDNPDGSEFLIVEKDGVPMKLPLYLAVGIPAPVIAAAPTSFTPTVVDHEQIDLTWSGTADNFIIERCRENDGAWQQIYSGATASFSDTELYPEEHYYYRLKSQVTGEFDSEWVLTDETTDPAP